MEGLLSIFQEMLLTLGTSKFLKFNVLGSICQLVTCLIQSVLKNFKINNTSKDCFGVFLSLRKKSIKFKIKLYIVPGTQ